MGLQPKGVMGGQSSSSSNSGRSYGRGRGQGYVRPLAPNFNTNSNRVGTRSAEMPSFDDLRSVPEAAALMEQAINSYNRNQGGNANIPLVS